MDATTIAKPRYLGLLNAISLAETEAGVYLNAWANATCDEDLACTLRLVAAREKSHGDVFCRRLAELGYSLRLKTDPESAERIAWYGNPKISDVEKITSRRRFESDPFGEIEKQLQARSYDPMTANLLAWYIVEERDSAKRLRAAYDCVCAKASGTAQASADGKPNGAAQAPAAAQPSEDAKAIMACMADGFARLERTLEKLAVH
jgi:hypothetical protein